MNDAPYFRNLKSVGNLYLSHVFLSFENEPIIFICTDNYRNLYLCLCSEIRNEQRWIISKCSLECIKSLIYKKIEIASVFLNSDLLLQVILDITGAESNEIISVSDLDRLDLPEDGVYLKCDIDAADDFLKKVVETLILTYNQKRYAASYQSSFCQTDTSIESTDICVHSNDYKNTENYKPVNKSDHCTIEDGNGMLLQCILAA